MKRIVGPDREYGYRKLCEEISRQFSFTKHEEEKMIEAFVQGGPLKTEAVSAVVNVLKKHLRPAAENEEKEPPQAAA